jgi:hypothetical protein
MNSALSLLARHFWHALRAGLKLSSHCAGIFRIVWKLGDEEIWWQMLEDERGATL